VHPDAPAGRGERVRAQAAAQVGQAAHPGGGQPVGPAVGHHRPGRLLEPRAGEQHRRGRAAELGVGPAAQVGLGEGGGGQRGGHPAGAQRGGRGQRLGVGDVGGGRQSGRPFGGTQGGEQFEVHGETFC
jgi:hypothetical protein